MPEIFTSTAAMYVALAGAVGVIAGFLLNWSATQIMNNFALPVIKDAYSRKNESRALKRLPAIVQEYRWQVQLANNQGALLHHLITFVVEVTCLITAGFAAILLVAIWWLDGAPDNKKIYVALMLCATFILVGFVFSVFFTTQLKTLRMASDNPNKHRLAAKKQLAEMITAAKLNQAKQAEWMEKLMADHFAKKAPGQTQAGSVQRDAAVAVTGVSSTNPGKP